MRSEQFAISAGSVVGAHHRKVFKNNQDALSVVENEHGLVAIVCDGCGSGKYSEVGAHVGAKFIANYLAEALRDYTGSENKWQELLDCLKYDLVNFLGRIANEMGYSAQLILDHFLFTVVGVIITENQCVVFSLGDGVFSVNQEVTVIDQNNTPEYLGYGILSNEKRQHVVFEIQKVITITEVESLFIATDGFDQVYSEAETKLNYLGSEISVAELCQFETGPKYLKNRSLVQKRLNVLGLNHGLLGDDTTVVLIRRRNSEIAN